MLLQQTAQIPSAVRSYCAAAVWTGVASVEWAAYEADGGRKVTVVRREHSISEVTVHRWHKQFSQEVAGLKETASVRS